MSDNMDENGVSVEEPDTCLVPREGCIGMKIRVNLLRPYTQEEIADYCSPVVDGRTGVIVNINPHEMFPHNDLCELLLDEPLTLESGPSREYFEFRCNLQPLEAES